MGKDYFADVVYLIYSCIASSLGRGGGGGGGGRGGVVVVLVALPPCPSTNRDLTVPGSCRISPAAVELLLRSKMQSVI